MKEWQITYPQPLLNNRNDRPLTVSGKYLRFLQEHGSIFGSVVHIRQAFEGAAALDELLVDAVRAATSNPDGTVKIRAFDGFSLNYDMTNRISRTPPKPDTTEASLWLQDVGGSSACVAINELSQWNVPLSVWYIERIQELIHAGGHLGTEILDSYTFISAGKGWTPFGIHNDYEPSFIYHLGPGKKRAWIWPRGEPSGAVFSSSPALNGVSFAISENLKSAQQYVLEPGDFLCIPAHLYHIFENTSPSAFLGITVFPLSHSRTMERLVLNEIRSLNFPEDTKSANLEHAQCSIKATTFDLAGRLPMLLDNFGLARRRLQSSGFIKKPHKEALRALDDLDFGNLFSARFPGAFQPAGPDTVFAFGWKCATYVDIPSEQLCELLNSMAPSSLADIATSINAVPAVARDMLTKFYLLGALVQS